MSVNFQENLIHAGSREGRGSVNNDGKNPIQQEDSSSKTPDRHMQWGIGQAQAVSATTWCARCRLRKYCIFTFFDAGIPSGRSCEITPLRLKKRENEFSFHSSYGPHTIKLFIPKKRIPSKSFDCVV